LSRSSLILPGYIIPIRPRGRVLEGFGIAVDEGRVAAILPERSGREKYPRAEVVTLPDHVVLPGLVNMHTHSPMTLMRGYADDLDLHQWLNEHIWPAESRHVSPEFVVDGTRLAIAEMIRAGTTCFNDNYFFPDAMCEAALESGMRAVIGLPLLDQASCWAGDFDEYMAKGLAVQDAFAGNDLIRFTLSPHAPYSVSDEGLDKMETVSTEYQLRVHLHCLETAYDITHSLENHGQRPLERLSRHGLLNDSLMAVHMTQLEDDEIELLADRGTHVIHCPQSNLKLASGVCPVSALVRAGVNVSIGTDGAASNNNLDMLEEVRFAALLAKGSTGDATALDAILALEMITINGALALGLDSQIGSIEVGKSADLCAINLASAQTQPLYNVFSQIAYAASSAQFTDVWVAGRRLMNAGNLATIDEHQVLAKAGAWQSRIQADRQERAAAS